MGSCVIGIEITVPEIREMELSGSVEFTGAEIEEAIVSARYLASRGKVVTTDDVVNAINRTFPISALRAESIESLRQWAKGRTVAA